MKSKYLSLLLGGALLFGATSCEDRLNIPQKGVLDYDSYYKTDAQAAEANVALYTQLKGLFGNYFFLKNLLSDDIWSGGSQRGDNASYEQINEYRFSSDHSFINSCWSSYYSMIYKANVILGHLDEDSQVKKQAIAEAKVFRAFAYFDLITLWGDVPLVDHELEASEYQMERTPKAQVWALVEQDLNEAINSGYLAEKSNVDDRTTWRVTKQFAQTMLGKAYLWQGKNAEAANQFNAVRKSGKYKLFEGNYGDMWTASNEFNSESMLESNTEDNTSNGSNFTFQHVMIHWRVDHMDWQPQAYAKFQTVGWGFCNPQKALYDAFVAEEGADGYRLNQSVKTYEQIKEEGLSVKPGDAIQNEGVFMWKYRFAAEDASLWIYPCRNYMWMRYAEVLLLGAEANLAAGNKAEALDCLNEIRRRAGETEKTDMTLEDVKIEKRLELCGEQVRFQDLLRWGEAEQYLKNQGAYCPRLLNDGSIIKDVYNTDANLFGFKKGKHELLPIPEQEMLLNPNMVQNPGW